MPCNQRPVRPSLQARALTGHGDALALGLRADGCRFTVLQTALERRWIMKARSTRLAVEALEDRCVPSTVAYGDFNHDGLMDMAALAAPKTITVSLANPDGSYTVSATLKSPKPIDDVYVVDFNADGNLDITGRGSNAGKYYTENWLGNGDGTFTYLEPWNPKP